uniref:CCD97-like C-terminal domain-containing protein n=1 Tax=Gasterosteus aculeatus aculeatus TaxID=481459 RepID=G3P0G2_GASAC|nr:coiled-coil domain-containing protein 97 [Gasterosteus aculeatus aculeatus]XP_040047601.1 coiled-coil domain-containing protein 97 [Gasterosteus aculeatus aculeatus]XP_040047602.1 coiled-coil domain-containing protein 97 [Gasterosteus aculeatus aculeatus]
MWGEIDPPARTRPSSSESEDGGDLPEEPVTLSHICAFQRPAEAPQPRQDPQYVSQAESICVNAMVDAIAASGILVKSQQKGEAELTLEERREELLHQYSSRPLVFLERYHTCLKPRNLSAFAHVLSDPRVLHYSDVIQRRAAACSNRTRVRNQRYAALRALQREGEYFSEEQMRIREPLLYEQYIGQYLTDEEVLERSQEAMQGDAQGGPGAPAGGAGGLAHLLLNSYQERLIQNRLQEEQEREDGAREEEEDDDDGYSVQQKQWAPTPEEKALFREEFISQMHQRFLDGKDKDFNYSEVDENPDFDNLDIVSRDAEDKYFDEDEEEEEEMENDGDNMTE